MSAFDAPEDDPAPGSDLHLMLASVVLGVWALGFGGLALLTGGGGLAIGLIQPPMGGPDEPSATQIMFMGLFEGLFFGALALPWAAAAYGIVTRQRWGLWVALVCLAFMAGGCCLPFAVYAGWALLRPEGRARFGY